VKGVGAAKEYVTGREKSSKSSMLLLRSMSREGSPIDNPIIESLNGRIKEELFLDFGLAIAKDVSMLLDEYVYYFNNRR